MVPLLKNQVDRPSRRGHVVKKGGLTHLGRGLRFRTEGQVRSKSRRLGDPDVLGDRSCDSDNLFSRGLLFLLLRDHGIEARWVRLGCIDALSCDIAIRRRVCTFLATSVARGWPNTKEPVDDVPEAPSRTGGSGASEWTDGAVARKP